MDNDSDSDVGDILNDLLSNDTEETPEPAQKKSLKELDFNFLDKSPEISNENKAAGQENKSEVYDDTIDSSDDEDRRYFEEQKYSEYGRNIKTLLKKDTCTKNDYKATSQEIGKKSFDFNNVSKNKSINMVAGTAKDVYSDPYFGLRIINPLVSSAELQARMNGKIAVTVSKVKYHISSDKVNNDWVIAGVLVNKSPTKTSQKGSAYCIWKITDLSENINTICLFVFSSAYKAFWKTTIGTVIGILNPNVLESKDTTDQATLSVDNPQKIMILGKSKDMGKCKSTKKNGEPCNSIVNINHCEFCIYHIKQEYKKCSRRAELQSSTPQRFSMDILKRKGPQQKVYNNAMPRFTPDYAVKNKALEAKDAERLALLSAPCKRIDKPKDTKLTDVKKNKFVSVELSNQQMRKDYERLNKLRGWKSTMQVISEPATQNVTPPILSTTLKTSSTIQATQNNAEKRGLNLLSSLPSKPRLGAGCIGGEIDFSEPITKKHINTAKINAIKWIQENGKIKPKNPNRVRPDKDEKLERGIKRSRETEDGEEKEAKKSNVLSDKFKEMLETKSAHTDLIEKSYEEEKDKYFNKLEMKERMEEKMLTTFKVPCKAVTCLICKYTSFSASDICKEQKHPLRVTDSVKRFFKCTDCGNRTVSLDRIPSHSCSKCSSSNWVRAAMMDEKRTKVPVAALSIRGDEESHLGSTIKDANLNLLVPENS